MPAVAIFWIDAEDHDWDEVRSCTVFDESLAPRSVSLPPRSGPQPRAGRIRPARRQHHRSARTNSNGLLPPTEFRARRHGQPSRSVRAGRGMAEAFGRWMESVLGSRGLVVYDSSDPASKPIASRVFAPELVGARRDGEAGRGRRMRTSWRAATTRRSTRTTTRSRCFTWPEARRAIRHQERAHWSIGDDAVASRRLAAGKRQTIRRAFSPNVLLRPIVQDTLFPTICYVAGPNELAYLGQLRTVYDHFGVPMPLMYPRASATLLDSAALRFLAKYNLPLEALQPQDESALNQLLETQIPPAVEESFTAAGQRDRARR